MEANTRITYSSSLSYILYGDSVFLFYINLENMKSQKRKKISLGFLKKNILYNILRDIMKRCCKFYNVYIEIFFDIS